MFVCPSLPPGHAHLDQREGREEKDGKEDSGGCREGGRKLSGVSAL